MASHRVFKLFPAVVILLLSACNNQAPPSAEAAKTTLCTDLARLNTSVATLKSLSPSSTVGDFRAARDQVKTSFNTVKTSAAAVQEARVTELEAAHASLDQAIGSVTNNDTLSQAAASIAPQIAAVEAAQNQMRSGLNCP